jgi:hypothetical protein
MQGVHLVLGFVDVSRIGPSTYNRRVVFVDRICRGTPIGKSWIDTAYGWDNPSDPVTRPIVIAAGATREEAINRRDGETLGWLYYDIRAVGYLAWAWRN